MDLDGQGMPTACLRIGNFQNGSSRMHISVPWLGGALSALKIKEFNMVDHWHIKNSRQVDDCS
jgi:hypothetical protein